MRANGPGGLTCEGHINCREVNLSAYLTHKGNTKSMPNTKSLDKRTASITISFFFFFYKFLPWEKILISNRNVLQFMITVVFEHTSTALDLTINWKSTLLIIMLLTEWDYSLEKSIISYLSSKWQHY